MFYFINYLRAFATVLITNSHFAKVWPISAMATGGLLGNVIFFAVSGFCLFEIKTSFPKWYIKRFLRVYPIMACFTLITVLLGIHKITSFRSFVYLFIYPTNYIFLVWLMLLYVLFYVVAWTEKQKEKSLEIIVGFVAVAWLLVYVFAVDKSVYTIDDVSKPFIMFLYFLSMLLGALIKKNTEKYKNFKFINVILSLVALIVYFATKIIFTRYIKFANLQILNQFTIIIALYFVFITCMGFENYLKKSPCG